MQFPYNISERTFSVFIDGASYQTDRSNPNWDKIKEALSDDAVTGEELIGLVRPVHAIAGAVSGVSRVQLVGNLLFFDNEVIDSVLASRIVDIVAEGLPHEGWIRFAENVFSNPAAYARDELYLFLEKADLPITPDGCFIAYKVVRGDYTDSYTGKFDNHVGRTVVMPGGRPAVDPERSHTCSRGLHFCSKGYLPSFGAGPTERVLLVKINPADVVSIPSDYDNAKGRTWRYEVVGEITREQAGLQEWAPYASGYDDYDWDEQGVDEDDGWSGGDFYNGNDSEEEADVPKWVSVDGRSFPVTVTVSLPAQDVVGTVIQSSVAGPIDKSRFTALLGTGSLRDLARRLGVSAGTVQAWKTKLG